ncbi:arginine--tRNA ligase, partial [Candidatus Nomurabacteria bacterium RIFCSPLOWO2_01_FULL_37_49]
MQEKIKNLIKNALKKLNIEISNIILEHPSDLKMGDYSTNVALAVAKNIGTNPKELAEKIVEILRQAQGEFTEIQEIQVAGAGFINFYLSRKFFGRSVEEILNTAENFGKNNLLEGQKIMVEYTDPNPFKPFHIGHLMTNAIGESVARILEHSGAMVARANYQGDVGLHIAKAIWGLQKNGLPNPNLSISKKAEYIGECYSLGATEYGLVYLSEGEKDSSAKKEIDEINKKLYSKTDEKINEIYDWGFKVTMEAFEELYKILGTKFELYFLESIVAVVGENIVRATIGKVFEESDGAIVFKAEKHDPKLHTRVFITSQGLPTYETKELGLTEDKFKELPGMNLCIVVTANEQEEYMKVVAKAISLIHPEY